MADNNDNGRQENYATTQTDATTPLIRSTDTIKMHPSAYSHNMSVTDKRRFNMADLMKEEPVCTEEDYSEALADYASSGRRPLTFKFTDLHEADKFMAGLEKTVIEASGHPTKEAFQKRMAYIPHPKADLLMMPPLTFKSVDITRVPTHTVAVVTYDMECMGMGQGYRIEKTRAVYSKPHFQDKISEGFFHHDENGERIMIQE